nr:hypothetical protein [Tanacetum cinerariifolium]
MKTLVLGLEVFFSKCLDGYPYEAPTPPRVCPTLRMRSWPLFTEASNGGTFLVLDKFCQDRVSESGGCGDDEPGDDKDNGEDEEDKDDS